MLFGQIEKELEISQRHLIVLKTVIDKGPIGILKLADETGMPAYKVRYSLRILEHKQLIEPSVQGAVAGQAVDIFIENFENQCKKLQCMLNDIVKKGREI